MPVKGNCFVVKLKKTHIEWGTHRYTDSREPIYGETYIPIPSDVAYKFSIYNSKLDGDDYGTNLYNYKAYIGNTVHSTGTLKAQGSQCKPIYAKNLSGNNNLKMLSPWIYAAGIIVGDKVEILFTSSTDLELRKV